MKYKNFNNQARHKKYEFLFNVSSINTHGNDTYDAELEFSISDLL